MAILRVSFAAVAFAVLAAVFPGRVTADETPMSAARALIEDLTARTTMPPISGRAKLDAASVEVCRALAQEFVKLQPAMAERVTRAFAESSNALVHAVLLAGLRAPDENVRDVCLSGLTSLSYQSIFALHDAGERLETGALAELANDEEVWRKGLARRVTELCSAELAPGEAVPDRVLHQQHALALICDLYGGAKGPKSVIEALLALLVGEPVEPIAETPPEAGERKALTAADELRLSRIKLMHQRRVAAQFMYDRLLIREADYDRLGASTAYDLRKEAAAGYWAAYDKRCGQAYGAWRSHLIWTLGNAELRDFRFRALLVMNDLLGGVSMAPAEGAPVPEGAPQDIPVFSGDTEAEKISRFAALDAREQRRRIRQVRRLFDEAYAKASGAKPE